MNIELDLERRIQMLEDIEAIKRLKVKYWNCVDDEQWEKLAECLAADFVFDSPHLGRMEGREHIIRVLQRAMKNVATVHQGHNPRDRNPERCYRSFMYMIEGLVTRCKSND